MIDDEMWGQRCEQPGLAAQWVSLILCKKFRNSGPMTLQNSKSQRCARWISLFILLQRKSEP